MIKGSSSTMLRKKSQDQDSIWILILMLISYKKTLIKKLISLKAKVKGTPLTRLINKVMLKPQCLLLATISWITTI